MSRVFTPTHPFAAARTRVDMGVRDWKRSHQTVLVLLWLSQLPGAVGRAGNTPELVGGVIGAAGGAILVVAGGRAISRRLRAGSATTSNG